MKLIIGGYAQGKFEYVMQQMGKRPVVVYDGELPKFTEEMESMKEKVVIVDHFHRWVKKQVEVCGKVEEEVMAFVDNFPDCIVICDEIGNGIVPIDPLEREYREQTGRILILLAKKAEEVERVICGIGQRIK